MCPAVRDRPGPGRGRRGRLPRAVAVRAWRRCRHRAGHALVHRFVDAAGELLGLGQTLVGEEVGEAAGVPLADRAYLPCVLAAVQLQRDDGRLGFQAGDGVTGDLVAVEAGDRDEGVATVPNRLGPPAPVGRASSTLTRWTASGMASRSTARRWSAAACRETSRPGRVGVPGWATHSTPWILPCSSPSVAAATIGVPAEIRISRRDWESGWFCPRTSSAVMPSSPCVACRVVCGSPGGPTGAAGSPASGPGTSGRWPGCRGRSSTSPDPSGAPSP